LAVLSPKASEIREAAERLHLECGLVPDSGYAKTPWVRPGMVLVKKGKDSKERIIQKIARQLQKNRSTTPVKP
jgi:signal recognition particle subunit SEC65